MPSWKATAPYTDPTTGEHWDGDKDIWALAHYVKSLVDLKGTKGADELRTRLRTSQCGLPLRARRAGGIIFAGRSRNGGFRDPDCPRSEKEALGPRPTSWCRAARAHSPRCLRSGGGFRTITAAARRMLHCDTRWTCHRRRDANSRSKVSRCGLRTRASSRRSPPVRSSACSSC